MQRVLGKKKTYLSLLRKYATSQANAAFRIGQALEQNDFYAAELVAHTVKGLAGNIGATAVQQSAAVLERLLSEKGEKKAIAEALVAFSAVLGKSVTAIENAIPVMHEKAPPESEEVSAEDRGKRDVICASLKKLLQEGDTEAAEFFAQHQTILKAIFPREFPLLREKIDQFDFDFALVVLKQAEEQNPTGVTIYQA